MALTGREMRPCWPQKVAVCKLSWKTVFPVDNLVDIAEKISSLFYIPLFPFRVQSAPSLIRSKNSRMAAAPLHCFFLINRIPPKDLQTAAFCGQQGRISRTVRAILNGQPGISAGQRVLRPTDQY